MSIFKRATKGSTEFLKHPASNPPIVPPLRTEQSAMAEAAEPAAETGDDSVAWTQILDLIGRKGSLTVDAIGKELGVEQDALEAALQTMQDEALLECHGQDKRMILTAIGQRAFKYSQIAKM